MIVYVDVAIVVSVLINGVLLWLPGRLLDERCVFWRLFLGTVVGVLYAVGCFLLDFYNILLSVAMAYIQILIVYRQKHLALWGTYLLSACVLAGWQQAFSLTGVAAFLLFFAGVFGTIALAKKIFLYIRLRKLRRKVHIGVGERTLNFIGYIDSGNRTSVAVIDERTAVRLLGSSEVSAMRELKQTEKVRYSVLTCTTVSGEGVMPVFRPDVFEIEGRKSKMQVGINFMPMFETMLLPKNELEVF